MMVFQRLLHLEGHSGPVLCCTSSDVPGAQHLVASGSEDGSVCLHDVNETRLAHKLVLGGEDDAVSSLVFHPTDPNQLFAASSTEVKRIDLRTGPSIASTFSYNKDEVNQVAVNAKGTFLAAADDAGDVQVLDLPSGKLFKSIQAAHSNIASSVCFRAHRPWELITAGFDQTVARWDFSRGKCLARMRIEMEATAEGESQLFNPPMVHAMAVPSTSSRPWCQVAAAARGDGTVEVFDVDKASSSSNSSAVSSGAKPGKGRGAAAVQGDPGAATAGRNAIGSSSSSGGGIMGNRGSGGRPWHWPLVLNRAGGATHALQPLSVLLGMRRHATGGDPAQGPVGTQEGASSSAPSQPKSNSGGSSGRPTKGVGSRTPTHLLSGSEDRRLLLWRLPRLGQGQAGGWSGNLHRRVGASSVGKEGALLRAVVVMGRKGGT